ncbi:MAG: hypothetical protein AB1439_12375 [candidate division FCPU426 bacterium]
MIVCTSVCANYLAKSAVLAETLKRHHPRARTVFCLVEKARPERMPETAAVDEWVLARDLGWKHFGRYIISHSRVEGATAIKARLLQYLLAHFPRENQFVYLDPDVMVTSDLRELGRLLERHPLVLTPHLLEPGNLEMEESCLNHGVFNLGFLGLRRSAEAARFLEWWSERLRHACYDDRANGLFTDQKWVDLAPAFFEVHLLRDPGYNVATWALQERKLTRRGGRLFANRRPVRFVHFSGFDQGVYFWAVDRWVAGNKLLARELGATYARLLEAHGEAAYRQMPRSYDFLDSGEKIPAFLRRAFVDPRWLPAEEPYDLTMKQLRRRLLPEQRWWRRLGRLAKKAGRRTRDILNGRNG